MEELTVLEREVAGRISNREAVKFGAFELKLHEKKPEAPLSPIYITLRLPPEGPLTEEDIEVIGQAIYVMVQQAGVEFDLVGGIPRAGEPIARVVSRLSDKPLLKLVKKTEGDRRKIDAVDGEYTVDLRVLIIDDLITQADTKKEAIGVVEEAKMVVAAIAVLIDRQQGGTEELEKMSYKLLAVFPLDVLLNHYVAIGKITQAKLDEVMTYVADNR